MQNGPTQPPQPPPPPAPPPKKKDAMGFVDSPWVQLGVPLGATIASAIAPRHMGRAAAGAIGTLDSVNQYRYGQKRLSELQSQQEQEEAAAVAKNEAHQARISSLSKFLTDYSSPGAGGPESGDVPRADMTAKTDAMEHGVTPKPTAPPITQQEAAMYQQLLTADPDMVENLIQGKLSSYGKEREGKRLGELQGSMKLGPGESVAGIPLEGGGTYGYNPPEAGPGGKPDMKVVEQGGQSVAVYFTPEGVQKRVTIGPAGADQNTLMQNFQNKLYARSVGKATGDAQFDNQWTSAEAEGLLARIVKENPQAIFARQLGEVMKGAPTP